MANKKNILDLIQYMIYTLEIETGFFVKLTVILGAYAFEVGKVRVPDTVEDFGDVEVITINDKKLVFFDTQDLIDYVTSYLDQKGVKI